MGAGGKFQYPKEVWSPAGGWWPYPAKWRQNTALALLGVAAICVPVFMISEQKSVRPKKPTYTIPWRRSLGSLDEDEKSS